MGANTESEAEGERLCETETAPPLNCKSLVEGGQLEGKCCQLWRRSGTIDASPICCRHKRPDPTQALTAVQWMNGRMIRPANQKISPHLAEKREGRCWLAAHNHTRAS